ncbi:MAG: DUF2997 domain-containing protein [Planctomycetota bacterium]|jgi:hypothetical protein
MSQEEIEIEVDKNGRVTIRTLGIKGKRCLDVAEALAEIIGKEQERTITSEFYESEIQVQNRIEIRKQH